MQGGQFLQGRVDATIAYAGFQLQLLDASFGFGNVSAQRDESVCPPVHRPLQGLAAHCPLVFEECVGDGVGEPLGPGGIAPPPPAAPSSTLTIDVPPGEGGRALSAPPTLTVPLGTTASAPSAEFRPLHTQFDYSETG